MGEQIRFSCTNPSCGKRLKAPPEHAGRRARCSCGQRWLFQASKHRSTRFSAGWSQQANSTKVYSQGQKRCQEPFP